MIDCNYGLAVVSPYVEMTQKQMAAIESNVHISIYMLRFYHQETSRKALEAVLYAAPAYTARVSRNYSNSECPETIRRWPT